MIRSLPLLFVMAISGCGAGVLMAPPKPATQAGGLGLLKIAPSALPVGEHLKARAEVLGLNVGRLDVSVLKPCDPALTPHLTVEAKLSTAGMLRFFNKTEGLAATDVDPVNFRTLRSVTHVDDGEEWREYQVKYKPGSFSYLYSKSNGEKKRGSKPVPEEEPVYDTQTAIALMRSWRPARVGEASYFYVVIGRQLWRADVTYRGPKKLEVQGKKTGTLLFNGVAHRVDLKPKEEYTPRHFAVWLQDDETRLPVQVSGDGSIGEVTFYLQAHDNAAACKPATKHEVAKAAREAATKQAALKPTEGADAKKAEPGAKKKKKKKRKRKITDPLPVVDRVGAEQPAPPGSEQPSSEPSSTPPQSPDAAKPPLTNAPVWTRDPTGTAEPSQ